VGWVKGFPLWSYAYLGWALVFAWWWTGMHTVGVRFFGIDIQQVTPWGLFSWLLLGLTAFVALLWTRSLGPIKRLFTDSWRDWTRLSLGMFTFAAFVLLIYDENHHPYLLAFMAAAKDDGKEGWPFCVRTRDGARTWEFLSWIGPQPADGGYAIMPSTVRLSETGLLTMIRRKAIKGDERLYWIEAYTSQDNGKSWEFLNKPTETLEGNPGHLIRLKDDRLLLTYGYRASPYGIRAKLSSDNGQSWGEEIILRDDGGNWDLGYPRTVQRPDGKVVVVYYFNDHENQERYIAATIWDPSLY